MRGFGEEQLKYPRRAAENRDMNQLFHWCPNWVCASAALNLKFKKRKRELVYRVAS